MSQEVLSLVRFKLKLKNQVLYCRQQRRKFGRYKLSERLSNLWGRFNQAYRRVRIIRIRQLSWGTWIWTRQCSQCRASLGLSRSRLLDWLGRHCHRGLWGHRTRWRPPSSSRCSIIGLRPRLRSPWTGRPSTLPTGQLAVRSCRSPTSLWCRRGSAKSWATLVRTYSRTVHMPLPRRTDWVTRERCTVRACVAAFWKLSRETRSRSSSIGSQSRAVCSSN